MDGGGITISTTQGIGALVFLVGALGTCFKIIQGLYQDRLTDCKETNRVALGEKDDIIEKLERRIERLEERDTRRSDLIERNQDVLNRAVDLLDRQTGVAETALKTRRRSIGGDD